mmetsp:Transcript_14324/g.26805  ORF Transcript_14324/g.26805 Transcript_14324/m.26805 type:complete len:521 (+) Transcript_14324:194-1756(+)
MEQFSSDSLHTPVSYAVSHWGSDPYIQGAWSQLSVGGSPLDREVLGSTISNRLILAGEACHVTYPAMVHGAALSGIHAAEAMSRKMKKVTDQDGSEGLPVVVIGAGAAGLHAASTMQNVLSGSDTMEQVEEGVKQKGVIVLEASGRTGGRVHTTPLPDSMPPSRSTAHTSTPLPFPSPDGEKNCVRVDLGASWLQQFPDNFLAMRAAELGLKLHPTDFQSALCAASDGLPLDDLHTMVDKLCDVAVNEVDKASVGGPAGKKSTDEEDGSDPNVAVDLSIVDALQQYIISLPEAEQRLANLALSGDINSDFGYFLHDTSARHALLELGIGNGDHYMQEGYSAVLEPVARDLNIRLNTPVSRIDWSGEEYVDVITSTGEVIRASHCICTVPVSILKSPDKLSFDPPLPAPHLRALRHIHQGKCEKVVLRFKTRWWPHSSNGLYRWYDCTAGPSDQPYFPMQLDWNEWLDMTDCLGVPVVVGFCVGEEACARHHGGRSDAEIAAAASRAFQAWAWHRNQLTDR